MPWICRESISTGHWAVAALCCANSPLVPLVPPVPHALLGAQLGPGLLFPSLLMLLSTIPAELRADVPGLAASRSLCPKRATLRGSSTPRWLPRPLRALSKAIKKQVEKFPLSGIFKAAEAPTLLQALLIGRSLLPPQVRRWGGETVGSMASEALFFSYPPVTALLS